MPTSPACAQHFVEAFSSSLSPGRAADSQSIPSTGPSCGSAGAVSGKRESEVNPRLQQLPSAVTCRDTAPALIPMPASPCEQDGPGGMESSPIPHASAGTRG